ncbi:MAG: hypothetical protein LBL00_06895, partial [Endomicrobium sp.]|nr:hypothetical protein [Endomicrobium sp.]
PGSFDKNTTLLGQIAVEYPQAWGNALNKSKAEIKALLEFHGEGSAYAQDLNAMLKFIDNVKNIQKGSVPEMPSFNDDRFQKVFYSHVLKHIEDMVSEVRASDSEVLRSMHEQIKDWHHYHARNSFDDNYEDALNFVESNFESIHEGYNFYSELLEKISNNADKAQAIRDLLNKKDPFAEELLFAGFNSDNSNDILEKLKNVSYFTANYQKYKTKMSEKANFVMQEGQVRNKLTLDENGKVTSVVFNPKAKKSVNPVDVMQAMLGKSTVDPNDNKLIESLRQAIEVKPGAESVQQYARRVVDWREKNAVALTEFMRKHDVYGKEEGRMSFAWDEQADSFFRAMFIIDEAAKYDVELSWAVEADQLLPGGKNSTMAYDIPNTLEIMDAHDALVPLMRGQGMYDRQYASEFLMKKRTGVIVSNPTMLIAGNDRAFPTSRAYGYAQDVWTNATQRALSGLLTFYGKGQTIPQIMASQLHPGEDSMQFMVLRFFYNRAAENIRNMIDSRFEGLSAFAQRDNLNNDISSVFTNYRTMIWQRPTFYSGGTEARYVWNTMLYVTEGIARTVNFGDSRLGYDVKVANTFLWMHYLNTPLVLLMIAGLPALIFFSSFSHLLPLLASVSLTYFFMQSINFGGMVLNASTGDGLTAMFKTIGYVVKNLAYFNSMFGGLMLAFKRGLAQIFNFFKTIKTTYFSGSKVVDMTKDYEYQTTFGVIAVLGTGLFTFLFITFGIVNPTAAVIILLPYIAAAVANVTGIHVYRAYIDKGTAKGVRVAKFWVKVFVALFLSAPILVAFLADTLIFMSTNKSYFSTFLKWIFNRNEYGDFKGNLAQQLNLETIKSRMLNPTHPLQEEINSQIFTELNKNHGKLMADMKIAGTIPVKEFADKLQDVIDGKVKGVNARKLAKAINGILAGLYKDDSMNDIIKDYVKNNKGKFILVSEKLLGEASSNGLTNLSNWQKKVIMGNIIRTLYGIDIESDFSYTFNIGYSNIMKAVLRFKLRKLKSTKYYMEN